MMAAHATTASPPHTEPKTGREFEGGEGLCKLPVFRPLALKLMRLTSDEETCLTEITRLLEAEPGLSAEVLALANSPLWGTRSTIHSLTRAITQIGWKRTESLVMTVALRAFVKGSPQTSGMLRAWRHSFSCALLADEIAPALRIHRGDAHTAGLLHDLGRLGLLAAYPERYAPLLDIEYESHTQAFQAEREKLGMDHCQAGGVLATAWAFPRELQEVACDHHQPLVGPPAGLPGLVAATCRLSTALGFGVLSMREPPAIEEVLAVLPLPWTQRPASEPEHLRDWLLRCLDSLDLR